MQTAEGVTGVDPVKPRDSRNASPAHQVVLPPLPADSAVPQKAAPAIFGLPQKIGLARAISDTAKAENVLNALGWAPSTRGGKIAALRFQSTGAKGVRVGLEVESLPLGGVLRFYGDASKTAYEVSAQEVATAIQRNLDAGDKSAAARTYWSPDLGGEAITVEFELPPGASPDSLKIAAPTLSHMLVDIRKLSSFEKIGEAGTCNWDVSCISAGSTITKSTALMEFVMDANTYVCTGTLLNDRNSSGTPYFLSANHCISNQTVASTLYTIWFYKSASCNSTQLDPSATAIAQGATLLYASADTDTSFLRLNAQPPAGAVFAGSSPFAPDPNDAVYATHHPKGDLQKYSEGTFMGTSICDANGCLSSTASNANYLRVRWTMGVTEGGSSGSGLFFRMNGKDYLAGQLFGGFSACTNPFGNDYYGRFDIAHSAALHQWLSAPSTTVRTSIYRFFNTATRAHFYTSSLPERDRVITKLPEYIYEGASFYAYDTGASGTKPVYRFFNTRTRAHFYTISEDERQYVLNNLPWYTFEGVTWYAYTVQSGSSAAIYRFYNTRTQTHFYTMSAAERDHVRQDLPEYLDEGVGYYGWTSP